MINITSYQGDAKPQRYTTLHHSVWPSQSINKKHVLVGMRKKGNSSVLLVGIQTIAITVENSMEFPHKTKDGTAFGSNDLTAGIIP